MTRKAAIFWLLLFYLLLRIFGNGGILPTPTPITMAIVIYESEIGKGATFQETEVLNGKLSQEIRLAKKWRQYDKDSVPDGLKPLLDIAAKEQKENARFVPWLFILHGTTVSWHGQLPIPEDVFIERVKQQGGL